MQWRPIRVVGLHLYLRLPLLLPQTRRPPPIISLFPPSNTNDVRSNELELMVLLAGIMGPFGWL